MLIVQIVKNNRMYSVHEDLHSFSYLFSYPAKVILANFTSSIFSVHSSTNLSTNFLIYLIFLWSKYSPTSHDLSHSLSQLIGFQISPLSQLSLSASSSHSHSHYLCSNVVYNYKTLHLIHCAKNEVFH